MSIKLNTLHSLAFAFLVAGCVVSPSEKPKPTHTDVTRQSVESSSLALQIMKADGMSSGLKDVDVEKPHEPGPGLVDDGLTALLIKESLLGRATTLPGVSSNAMSAFFILESLSDQTILPRRGRWMPVRMPHSMAENLLDAELKMSSIMEKAVAEALTSDYQVAPYEWTDKAIFGAESAYRVLRVDGPLCEKWSCVIKGSLKNTSRPELYSSGRLIEAESPDFLEGSEKSYRYRNLADIELGKVIEEDTETGRINGRWHRIKTEPIKGYDYSGFYQRLSEALPSWAYIYFGPENTDNHLDIPFILNSGQKLFFIKPDS